MFMSKYVTSKGASLVEVMVALFILAVGMLGVLAMQASAIRLNNNAYLYSQANILAMEMVEAIRSTPGQASNYAQSWGPAPGSTPAIPDCSSSCDAATIAAWNIAQWQTTVAAVLPGGQGQILQDSGNSTFTVSVTFNLTDEDSGEIVQAAPVTIVSAY